MGRKKKARSKREKKKEGDQIILSNNPKSNFQKI